WADLLERVLPGDVRDAARGARRQVDLRRLERRRLPRRWGTVHDHSERQYSGDCDVQARGPPAAQHPHEPRDGGARNGRTAPVPGLRRQRREPGAADDPRGKGGDRAGDRPARQGPLPPRLHGRVACAPKRETGRGVLLRRRRRPGGQPQQTLLLRVYGHVMRKALLIALAVAALGGLTSPAARADGDPASDVLYFQDVFLPYAKPSADASKQLGTTVAAANKAGFRIKVAVIRSEQDLGSVPSLFNRQDIYARFLGTELKLFYTGRLLVVMPAGYG